MNEDKDTKISTGPLAGKTTDKSPTPPAVEAPKVEEPAVTDAPLAAVAAPLPSDRALRRARSSPTSTIT